MKRIVSIWLPHWPTDRLNWLKSQGMPGESGKSRAGRADCPFALTLAGAGGTGGVRLYAVNPAAVVVGLTPGMTLADARARIPALKVQKAAPAADIKALRKLARWCVRYTPWVNIDAVNGYDADSLVLDISGCGHLFGGEGPLLEDLSSHLLGFGLNHRLAIAPTRGAAWALAHYEARYGAKPASDVMTSIKDGECIKQRLGPYPVEVLRIGGASALTLRRLGLKTIAQVADIPRIALKRRFPSRDTAAAVLLRLDQALGEEGEPVSPLSPAPAFRTRVSFPEPVTEPVAIERALAGLLHDLMAVLESENMGARRLSLTAWCVDGGLSRIALGTSRPSRDQAHFSFLFGNKIEQIDIKEGIDLLVLNAETVEKLNRQQFSILSAGAEVSAVAPSSATREKAPAVPVSHLADRLSNRLGEQAVRRSVLRESHIPERAERRPMLLEVLGMTSPARVRGHKPLRPMRPMRPMRLFERPEPLDVIAEVPDGPPLRFRWRRMSVRVALAEGPERISPEWWLSSMKEITREGSGGVSRYISRDTRDYYRLEDDLGRRFWVYRAGLYQNLSQEPSEEPMPPVAPVTLGADLPRWFMHGLFA